MKKIALIATSFALLLGMTSMANAAEFTASATTALGSGGATFSPSTNVSVDAIATATNWAAASKHTAGGTIMYGMLSTDTNITTKTGMAADAAVTNQTSATALTGF